MQKKQKVVLSKVLSYGGPQKYRVEKLVNRLKPPVGSELHERDAEDLVSMEHLTVEIIKPRG